MTTAYTSLLGLALPVTGELTGTWGDTVNDYITTYLDGAVAGTQIISGSLTAVTLSKTTGASLSQAGTGATGSSQYQIIRCTGNPASLLTITVPAADKTYVIINATSTSQSVKIVGAGPTTGVTILSGKTSLVTWNGSDFVEITPAVATNLAPASTAGYVYTSTGGSTPPSFQALSVSGYLPTTGGTMTGAITFASNQFGTNVNTFLTTPSSANLAAALTDETGTGVNVFNNTPTLIAPILGTPTSGDLSNCTNAVGYGLKSATTTVSVSAATAPTAGQVLMATSSTAATWQSPGGSSALVLLATVTASAATTVNFRNSFSSTYDTYLILCNNLSMSTSASLGMQFAVAGTADANAIYGWQRLQSYNNSFSPYAAGGQTSYQVGDVITTSSNSTIAVTISGVNSTLRGKVCSSNYGNCGATGVNALIGQNIGVWGGASVASGVQFLHDGSATISGTFYLYGYAKS